MKKIIFILILLLILYLSGASMVNSAIVKGQQLIWVKGFGFADTIFFKIILDFSEKMAYHIIRQ